MIDIEKNYGSGDAVRLHIAEASRSWRLLMQSGVELACTVGQSAASLLTGEMAISEDTLAKIEAVLLDGLPLDDIDAAIIPENARLALAAGLPGIAGLAMKRGSAVRALRAGIGLPAQTAADPRPGRITLCLYGLAIDILAADFLARGVLVTAAQLRRYARFAQGDRAVCAGECAGVEALVEKLERSGQDLFKFSAVINAESY